MSEIIVHVLKWSSQTIYKPDQNAEAKLLCLQSTFKYAGRTGDLKNSFVSYFLIGKKKKKRGKNGDISL